MRRFENWGFLLATGCLFPQAHIKPKSSKPGKQLAMEFVQSSKEPMSRSHSILSKAHRDSTSPLMFSVLVSRGVFFSPGFCIENGSWQRGRKMVDYMDKSIEDDGR